MTFFWLIIIYIYFKIFQRFYEGNREKGWNDPPEFLHAEKALNLSNQKPTVLNQRVSHNLDNLTKTKVSQTPTEKLTEPPKSTVAPKTEEKTVESTTNASEAILSVDQIEAILNVQIENLKAKQTPVSFH